MVVRLNLETNGKSLDLLHWGLVLHFTKDLKAACKPINARSETAASSGMFRGALERRRCLVHADAFYEWRAMPNGKRPYAIGRRALRSFAILTTSANATMWTLHDRVSVILGKEQWPVWLGERAGEPGNLMQPADDGLLHLWTVSRAVNNVRNNGPDLLDRVDDPHAPPPSDASPGDNPA